MTTLTTTKSECPCEECICLPVCRHKPFDDLLADCKIVRDLLYYNDGTGTRTRVFSKTLVGIKNTLEAYTWYCEIQDNGYAKVGDSNIPDRNIGRNLYR